MRFARLLALSLALSGVPTAAHAQLFDRLVERAERAAKQEIEAKVDREVRKITRCALGDATCIKTARARGDDVEVVRDEAPTTLRAPKAGDPVHFPEGAISYADKVSDYSPGEGEAPSRAMRNQNNALGEPDHDPKQASDIACTPLQVCPLVALGRGGRIDLLFTDNVLTGSGDDSADLWVFGIQPGARLTVHISVDGQDWLSVGEVDSEFPGIDVDAYGFGPYTAFTHVRLTDIAPKGGRDRPAHGATIDAIGAISTRRSTK